MASTFRLGAMMLGRPSSVRPATSILRPALWCRSSSTVSSTTGSPQLTPVEDYVSKNVRLGRPLSPHLTIYKPQLTSMLSITHRGTGVFLSLGISAFSIAMMAAPSTYPYYLGLLSEAHLGGLVIVGAKMSLAFPFVFHTLNGVRHLFWDLGYGFSLPALYKSGYGVLLLSFLISAALSAY